MASRFSFLHPTGRESRSANFSARRFWFRALRPGPPRIWCEPRLTIRQRWTIRGGRQNFGPRDLRGVPLIFLSALLVVIRLDDIAHDGSRRARYRQGVLQSEEHTSELQ